jgi:hypothetical protein
MRWTFCARLERLGSLQQVFTAAVVSAGDNYACIPAKNYLLAKRIGLGICR